MEDEPVVMAALHDGIGQRALDKFRVDVLAHGIIHRLLVAEVKYHGKVQLNMCNIVHIKTLFVIFLSQKK